MGEPARRIPIAHFYVATAGAIASRRGRLTPGWVEGLMKRFSSVCVRRSRGVASPWST